MRRCHGEKGDGKGVTYLYLDPAPRDLTKAAFMNIKARRTLPAITEGRRAGDFHAAVGTRFERAATERRSRVCVPNFVKEPRRELKDRKVPEKNPVAFSAESVAAGEQIFLQRCTGCHGRKADGKGPNSLDISPRPRNLRNSFFVNNVSDRRLFDSITYGVEGTAMPSWVDYGLTQNDVGNLINFIRSLNQKPAAAPAKEKTPQLTSQLSRSIEPGGTMPEMLQVNPARVAAGVGAESIHEDTTAKWFLLSSISYFFVVGIIALTIAAKFVWPSLLGSVSVLTYGRLRPLHVNGMLFGWLLAADMGLAYYIVPRLCGVKLWSEKLGVATAIIWNIIILGAVVALPLGFNKGWEYAELPIPLTALVVVAWVCFGINIFGTIATRKYEQMYVSLWYTMGTILWTTFVYSTGNIAVFFTTGVNQANLNWMYVHNAVGLIFTPIGLAIAYYFIPKASNTPLHSHKLSMIGFWSLAFVYVWTGAHHMLHGPISQWLQTISIVFSVMLLIPGVDGGLQLLRHHAGTVAPVARQRSTEVPMSGVVFYLLTCFQGPMHSLRSVNAIVSKTDWIPGHAHMALLGCFSFFAIAGCYYVDSPAVPYRTAFRCTGQLELLVLHDRRPGFLCDPLAGRILAGLAMEQSVDSIHRHGPSR